MSIFEDFNITKQLLNAIDDLGFKKPTPIQKESFSVIMSGKDVVGIAQTGTGKTFAYLLPILNSLKYSKQIYPRILILVPTRELVLQVLKDIESLTKYMSMRTLGVYGGTNMKTQKKAIAQGTDIIVATPGRLIDLALTGVLQLKEVKRLVIDEVDIMLDLGFRFQLINVFDLMSQRRQNIMYSATMTNEVDVLIENFFIAPKRISIALSGTPLDNIRQTCYYVLNYNTKVNLLKHLLNDKEVFSKVLVFISGKRIADRLFEVIEESFPTEACIIHSNKSQNYRIRSIQQFDEGVHRIIVATDVMARGLDIEKVSHVINFDTPGFPENYMHRIGRTGRAEKEGKSVLFYTEKENEAKEAIEALMDYKIPLLDFPEEVKISQELTPEERPKVEDTKHHDRNLKKEERGPAFHEKKEKNKKTNQGGSYLRKMKNYKKPKTRGDKNVNKKKKRRH